MKTIKNWIIGIILVTCYLIISNDEYNTIQLECEAGVRINNCFEK